MAPKAKKSSTKKIAKASGAVVLKLREVLDISYAEKLKKEIAESFEKSAEVGLGLDASGVNRITTPCIQVILAVAKSCSMASVGFKIAAPSEAFSKAFADVGLENQLSNWAN